MAEQGKIDIPLEVTEKIFRYIKEGRFSDMSDFFTQAAKLMLLAEDNKEYFSKFVEKKE